MPPPVPPSSSLPSSPVPSLDQETELLAEEQSQTEWSWGAQSGHGKMQKRGTSCCREKWRSFLFCFFFSTMGRLTVGAKGARAPKYRSGQSLLLLRACPPQPPTASGGARGSAAGPGPQWGWRSSTGWREQSWHPIRSLSSTGAGAAQDLEAAPTMQGVAGIRVDSPITTKTDGTWDLSSPPGIFCILY